MIIVTFPFLFCILCIYGLLLSERIDVSAIGYFEGIYLADNCFLSKLPCNSGRDYSTNIDINTDIRVNLHKGIKSTIGIMC